MLRFIFVSHPSTVIHRLLLLIILFLQIKVSAQDSLKVCHATRIQQPVRLDGILDDAVWSTAESTTGFTQQKPNEGQPSSQHTEVKIVYTDYAIYVGAMMYDTSPDSILHQLGKRDDDGLNSDFFFFKIDTYHNHQDAYQFAVYASGVQRDFKFTDETFDAVWKSAVNRSDKGWSVEMEIPYSAIRFPKVTEQVWGLQFVRYIRRNRESSLWASVPNTATNPELWWGRLEGINNVQTPVRLALIPYVSAGFQHAPEYNDEGSFSYGSTINYSAGADVKYGIDNRFTLDMTLFPDFGQVQSDKLVKNLSYREVEYDENRPFFKEGTELFNKADLFYSRRIGKIPGLYSAVYDNLQDGEKVVSNPSQVKLLNALKISGRTDEGLGIGFFNAVTDNTYAEIERADGTGYTVRTEPLTNYNVVSLDQQFKSNSKLYFINTSTIRAGDNNDANATAGGFSISNKKNTAVVYGQGIITQRFSKNAEAEGNVFNDDIGYQYLFGADKKGGKFTYGVTELVRSKEFNTTDLGYYKVPGQIEHSVYFNYSQYQPWRGIREMYPQFRIFVNQDFSTHKTGGNEIHAENYMAFMSYNSIFYGGGWKFMRDWDYNESRTEGRVFHGERYWYGYAGISSDYRKMFAVDYTLTISNFIDHFRDEGYTNELSLRFRPTDKLFLIYDFEYNFDPYNVGYASDGDNGEIFFGGRRLDTWTNELSATYIFTPDMNLTVNARHYWITGAYRDYFLLQENGELLYDRDIPVNNDFNFNAFNVDVVYEWRFSPGSILDLIYKNGITSETGFVDHNYKKNVNELLRSPQSNTFSVKMIYYLDYQRLRQRRKI